MALATANSISVMRGCGILGVRWFSLELVFNIAEGPHLGCSVKVVVVGDFVCVLGVKRGYFECAEVCILFFDPACHHCVVCGSFLF